LEKILEKFLLKILGVLKKKVIYFSNL
jgi:hypothetical protein